MEHAQAEKKYILPRKLEVKTLFRKHGRRTWGHSVEINITKMGLRL
jgi:hypothetical protein